MSSSSLVIFFFFLLLPSTPQSLVLHIPTGKPKCLTEDLPRGAISLAAFSLLSPNHTISAHVTDPDGETVREAKGAEAGKLAFEAAEKAGRYTLCFFASRFALGEEISVDLDWKVGVAAASAAAVSRASELRDVAKKQTVDAVEDELRKLEESANLIYAEMKYLHEREEEGHRLYEDMNSRMGMLSLLSLAICLGVSGLQLWHLKTFFEREKIL